MIIDTYEFINKKDIENKLYDLDIEYSHIYIDNLNTVYQSKKSIEILKQLLKNNTDKEITTSVLIDDYNKSPILDINKYLKEYIYAYNIKLDNIIYESSLCNIAEYVITNLLGKTKNSYFKKHNKTVLFFKDIPLKQILHNTNQILYTCPILTLSWYLVRLGLIENNIIKNPSKKLINILDSNFKYNEDNVIELLKNTKYKEYSKKIEYILY